MPINNVVLVGAGGKMGLRLAANLKKSSYRVRHVEISEAGQAALSRLGFEVFDIEQAVVGADAVILAVPDRLIGKVAHQIEHLLAPGVMVVCLDAAAPFAGEMPEREDLAYFITHPCHPPVIHDEKTPEGQLDFFGGIHAKQHIVCCLMQGRDGAYMEGVRLARVIYGPVMRAHRCTVEQMAILEPVLSETVAATCMVVIKEAVDEAVRRGVPAQAAEDFVIGHLKVEIGIAFKMFEGAQFSDGALLAIENAKQSIFQPDWKKVFDEDAVKQSVRDITQPPKPFLAAMSDRIHAIYWVETAFPLQQAAEVLAGEQSSGTFISLPGETPELKACHGAVVEHIEELGSVDAPSLPGAGVPKGETSPKWKRANVHVSWPLGNLGPSLPNLQATVAGNLFELKQFSGLRLIGLSLPQAFRDAYPGPQFGVAGTRKLVGVERLPLIGTIVKPSVGLSPDDTADMVRQLAEGGLDFIKDDELQADGPHCPFAERVEKVMRVLRNHAEKTGKMVMFAFNVTGEIDEMRRRHDLVVASGGTCVMASIHSIGLPGMTGLRSHSQLPIHAHRNGWGIYGRSPHIGIDYKAWQKFWRLAGADHMHVNGLRNKFCEADESVISSAKECLTPMFDGEGRGCEVMPVFSSGQWADQAFDTYAALGSSDLIHAAGGGIMGHPGGIAAGAASMRAAWEGALAGLTREQVAAASPEFRQAQEQFGS